MGATETPEQRRLRQDAAWFLRTYGEQAARKKAYSEDHRFSGDPVFADLLNELADDAQERANQARRSTTTASTPTTGGTAVSIEDIRSAVAEVEQRVSTAAHQLHTVRGELDEAAGLLAQLSQGSNAAELSDALGVLRDLSSELEQAGQRAINTGESALAYAGRL